MNLAIVRSLVGVTLVGGGPLTLRRLARSLSFAPRLVAADGGADRLLRLGQRPEAVIGDLDSISAAARAELGPAVHLIPEQESTDFEKALTRIDAPFVLGLGFSGARLDHGLAVLNAMVRHPDRRCLIIGGGDVTFLAPHRLQMTLPVGSRLSLFPMAAVTGQSQGLRWPIEGLRFAPDGAIGTSNEVSSPRVDLSFDAEAMLVILPERALPAVLDAVSRHPAVRGG
ncbi:MAG: thiamine diphosphokinase [Paracoccaceae bacterium]